MFCQKSLSWVLFDVLLVTDYSYGFPWVMGRKTTEAKCRFHHMHDIKSTRYQHGMTVDINLDHQSEARLFSFLHFEVLFLPCLHTVLFARQGPRPAHV